MTNDPTWLVYERCVAAYASEQYSDLNFTVQPNVKLIGLISGIERQVDVLVDSRWDDGVKRRIIIDAKERKRKIDIKDVESFEGMLKDCQANHGIIVCSNGYTEAAYRRAQEFINIVVLPLEEIQTYEWVYEQCLNTCQGEITPKNKRGMVLWSSYMAIPSDVLIHILQTGKCDGCHSFHVWCWDCGVKFAVPDRSVYHCDCGHDWIAYPDQENEDKSMLLMLRLDAEFGAIIDRRSIV
jgi:hypothetical protein